MKLEPLAPDIQALLEAERDFPPEPPERKARVLAAITQVIGPGLPPSSDPGAGGDSGAAAPPSSSAGATAAGATAGTAAGAGSAAVTTGMSTVIVVAAAAFAAGGLTGAGAYHMAVTSAPPQTVIAGEPAPTPSPPAPTRARTEQALSLGSSAPQLASSPEDERSADETLAEEAPTRPRAQKQAAPPAEPEGAQDEQSADERNRERQLIEIARVAVSRGNASTAIAAINRHAQQFPRGRLSEEREALRILALIAAGRRGEAEDRAQQFRASHPRSVFGSAIERALGSSPSSP